MFSPTWSFSWFRSSRVSSPVEGTSWAHSHERMADGEAAWLLSADSQRTDGFYLPLEITGRTALWSSPSCLWAYPQPPREGLPWLSTVFFCSTGCDTAWDMKGIPSYYPVSSSLHHLLLHPPIGSHGILSRNWAALHTACSLYQNQDL